MKNLRKNFKYKYLFYFYFVALLNLIAIESFHNQSNYNRILMESQTIEKESLEGKNLILKLEEIFMNKTFDIFALAKDENDRGKTIITFNKNFARMADYKYKKFIMMHGFDSSEYLFTVDENARVSFYPRSAASDLALNNDIFGELLVYDSDNKPSIIPKLPVPISNLPLDIFGSGHGNDVLRFLLSQKTIRISKDHKYDVLRYMTEEVINQEQEIRICENMMLILGGYFKNTIFDICEIAKDDIDRGKTIIKFNKEFDSKDYKGKTVKSLIDPWKYLFDIDENAHVFYYPRNLDSGVEFKKNILGELLMYDLDRKSSMRTVKLTFKINNLSWDMLDTSDGNDFWTSIDKKKKEITPTLIHLYQDNKDDLPLFPLSIADETIYEKSEKYKNIMFKLGEIFMNNTFHIFMNNICDIWKIAEDNMNKGTILMKFDQESAFIQNYESLKWILMQNFNPSQYLFTIDENAVVSCYPRKADFGVEWKEYTLGELLVYSPDNKSPMIPKLPVPIHNVPSCIFDSGNGNDFLTFLLKHTSDICKDHNNNDILYTSDKIIKKRIKYQNIMFKLGEIFTNTRFDICKIAQSNINRGETIIKLNTNYYDMKYYEGKNVTVLEDFDSSKFFFTINENAIVSCYPRKADSGVEWKEYTIGELLVYNLDNKLWTIPKLPFPISNLPSCIFDSGNGNDFLTFLLKHTSDICKDHKNNDALYTSD